MKNGFFALWVGIDFDWQILILTVLGNNKNKPNVNESFRSQELIFPFC